MDITVSKILMLMDKQGINANQLQQICGLNRSAIYEWKKGKAKPKREALQKIAEYFDKPLSFFYEEKEAQANGGLEEGLTEEEIEQLKDYRDLLIAARSKK